MLLPAMRRRRRAHASQQAERACRASAAMARLLLRSVCCCVSLLPLAVSTWRDPEIASSSTFVLDGSDWTLTGEGREMARQCTGGVRWAGDVPDDGCCNFVHGVDYTAGSTFKTTGVAYAMDQSRCCETCAATDGCAAAVWKSSPPGPPPTPVPPAPPSTKCNFVKDIDFHPETVLT
jgi:hypothetical protein